jgi:hypothetical protein
MNKYILEITEDEAIVLFEFFSRFDETDNLTFQHPAEYLAFEKLSGQIEKTTAAMFKPEYNELLSSARNRIAEGFEGEVPKMKTTESLEEKR